MLRVAANPWIVPLISFFVFRCSWCVAAVVGGDDDDDDGGGGGGVDDVL